MIYVIRRSFFWTHNIFHSIYEASRMFQKPDILKKKRYQIKNTNHLFLHQCLNPFLLFKMGGEIWYLSFLHTAHNYSCSINGDWYLKKTHEQFAEAIEPGQRRLKECLFGFAPRFSLIRSGIFIVSHYFSGLFAERGYRNLIAMKVSDLCLLHS